MRKIAVFNQKGGVGKTTTAVNIAAGLSRNGKKVCLVDLDPQGSINTWHDLDSKKNLYDLLVNNADLSKCTASLGRNLDVIWCDERIAEAEAFMHSQEQNHTILDQRFTPGLDYDYAILDCPPSLRLMNQNALFYAREAIIPFSTDILGKEALKKTMGTINKLNGIFSHKIMVSSIVPTLFDRRNKVCKTVLQEVRKEYTPFLVTEPIRNNSKLKEAPKAKKSIFNYAKSSPGAQDYWKLVKLMLENEYMYDSKIKAEQRELAIKEYFVDGKKRELTIINNKPTFSFKYFTQVHSAVPGQLYGQEEKGRIGV